MSKQVVLVTGASSGIGKSTATLLMKEGFHVYGTSRNAEVRLGEGHAATDEKSGGFINMIPLDVTDEASVKSAVNAVISREGHIDVLVNNAGMGIAGSIEDTSMEEAEYQFDTNFFGTLRVMREVLPYMRERHNGRIIVLSSIAGVISIPYQAHYSASKFALEALIEALRHEIASFGITACLVEPGDTKTEFTAKRRVAKLAGGGSPYREHFERSLARMEHDEQNGSSPDAVAGVIYKMIRKRKPPIRTAVGVQYKAVLFLKKILPAGLVEKIIEVLYG